MVAALEIPISLEEIVVLDSSGHLSILIGILCVGIPQYSETGFNWSESFRPKIAQLELLCNVKFSGDVFLHCGYIRRCLYHNNV